jgi:hypothetical protein
MQHNPPSGNLMNRILILYTFFILSCIGIYTLKVNSSEIRIQAIKKTNI